MAIITVRLRFKSLKSLSANENGIYISISIAYFKGAEILISSHCVE